MAIPEHLEILQQGVEVWNAWRHEHPQIQPNLRDADLRYAQLDHVNFQGAILNDVDLQGASLHHANFSDAELPCAHLEATNLYQANLTKASLDGVSFDDAQLVQVQGYLASCTSSSFHRTNLHRALFSNAHFDTSSWFEANLSETILSGASFYEATLEKTSIQQATLRGTDFSRAQLLETDFKGSNLYDTMFHYTQFSHINLTEATVGWTNFIHVDLRQVLGLETVHHLGPSEISTSTLYCSEGHIPPLFLQRCGVPASLLSNLSTTFLHTPKNAVTFLCYCIEDHLFATRLAQDLQQQGIYCWLAPYNKTYHLPFTGSEMFWAYMSDTKINYDRLILIASDAHDQNDMPYFFVREGQRKEEKQQQRVIFPVKLSSNMFSLDLTHYKTDTTYYQEHIQAIRQKAIDFISWQDKYLYAQALKELLSQLDNPAQSD